MYSGFKSTFNSNPATPSFSQFHKSKNASDVIIKRKQKAILCASKICDNIILSKKSIPNNIYLSNYFNYLNPNSSFNKNELYINLVTQLDLSGVTVASNLQTGQTPLIINPTSDIPFLNYSIDPSGSLFGNNICGLNNYNNYRQCLYP